MRVREVFLVKTGRFPLSRPALIIGGNRECLIKTRKSKSEPTVMDPGPGTSIKSKIVSK